MARPGTTSPDLVGELRALRNKVEALERKPIPQSLYDQYPCVEWAATPRGPVDGNEWSSVSVANVTGLRYDRIESKFVTYNVKPGRSEAEVRLAAFRHSYSSSLKECISATSTVRLTGNTDNVVSVCKWRWIHGIPFGWDYTDGDDAIYTIELQHRNPDDCPVTADPAKQVFGPYKNSDKSAPSGFDQIFFNNGESQGQWIWGNMLRYTSSNTWVNDGTHAPYSWNNLPGNWDGKYNLSQMHYCVGVPQERAPGASTGGWFWIVGGGAEFVRDPDITEPAFNV